MLFLDRVRDYQVVASYFDKFGSRQISTRVCHQMTRKEARAVMQRYLLDTLVDKVDVDEPIKLKVTAAND